MLPGLAAQGRQCRRAMCRTSLFSTGPAVRPDHAIWFAENRLLWRRRRRFGQVGLPGNWLLRGLTQRDCPRNEHGRPSPPQVQSRPRWLRVQTEWCDPTKTKPSRRENNFRGGWASRAESHRPGVENCHRKNCHRKNCHSDTFRRAWQRRALWIPYDSRQSHPVCASGISSTVHALAPAKQSLQASLNSLSPGERLNGWSLKVNSRSWFLRNQFASTRLVGGIPHQFILGQELVPSTPGFARQG